ncbi:hypothetical protein DPMN_023031 [Dreissena polymorpha]|uniref:Uncharacterized protein n=1 Tax=Dreissena polymorpha TaxID=45954 RepID=A0A9D4LLC6_DREPO|nr:hypothetical protein DPMN_023031 [Dreissena polymorpha]
MCNSQLTQCIQANNIIYHKISDPCDLVLDGTCPVHCDELPGNKNGTSCTWCDCKGTKHCAFMRLYRCISHTTIQYYKLY